MRNCCNKKIIRIFAPLNRKGKVPEWSIGPHSKCGVRATVPGVRIPPFPLNKRGDFVTSFCFSRKGRNSFSRWRFGRLICVWQLFAIANHCLCPMIVFENKFSDIISQTQQSLIATAPLRSPLNCCDRSSSLFHSGWFRGWGEPFSVFSFLAIGFCAIFDDIE